MGVGKEVTSGARQILLLRFTSEVHCVAIMVLWLLLEWFDTYFLTGVGKS
jgi:hypothetical protein